MYDTYVIARKTGYSGLRFGLYIYRKVWNSNKIFIAEPIKFVEHELNTEDEPTLSFDGLDIAGLQGLMDSLWECGIRPSEGQGSAGQLAAVQKHLEDMRTFANRLLDKELSR